MAANELFPKRLRALRERRQIKRRVLADYFDVTVDYLLGRE